MTFAYCYNHSRKNVKCINIYEEALVETKLLQLFRRRFFYKWLILHNYIT